MLFFRESCFRQSGDKKRGNNPTHYRNPRDYFRVFDCATRALEDGRVEHFELISCKCVDTYVRVKQNQNQIAWRWRKVGNVLLHWCCFATTALQRRKTHAYLRVDQ